MKLTGSRERIEDIHGWCKPLDESLIAALRLIEFVGFPLKHAEDSFRKESQFAISSASGWVGLIEDRSEIWSEGHLETGRHCVRCKSESDESASRDEDASLGAFVRRVRTGSIVTGSPVRSFPNRPRSNFPDFSFNKCHAKSNQPIWTPTKVHVPAELGASSFLALLQTGRSVHYLPYPGSPNNKRNGIQLSNGMASNFQMLFSTPLHGAGFPYTLLLTPKPGIQEHPGHINLGPNLHYQDSDDLYYHFLHCASAIGPTIRMPSS
ncbi:hypothetical protein H4582DRAFT_2063799 [Lactarius indigo]|nr:hypothetical protein H4582DRAFT_2063799 [Lactarius indigo]